MQATASDIDTLLVAALRDEAAPWPDRWVDADRDAVIDRLRYHGISGLLIESTTSNAWPAPVRSAIQHEATAQAMWDMRHGQIVGDLLSVLAARAVRHVVLKGTALAYSRYDSPHHRARADSDLLVGQGEVAATRSALRELGFTPSWGEMADLDAAFQEGWGLRHADGSFHQLDLHWQAINARALRDLMPVGDCLDHAVPLDRLSSDARTLDPPRLLLHTCLHRLMHRTAPYVVGGKAYYGGERLIWAVDIQKLAAGLDGGKWRRFVDLAVAAEVAPVCLDAFDYAQRTVGIALPADVRRRLADDNSDSAASRYLLESGRGRRLIHNLRSGGGVRAALAFARAQIFPPAEVLRAQYPDSAGRPVGLLRLHRWVGFALPKWRGF